MIDCDQIVDYSSPAFLFCLVFTLCERTNQTADFGLMQLPTFLRVSAYLVALIALGPGLALIASAHGREQSTASAHSVAIPPAADMQFQLAPTATPSASGASSAPLGRSMAGPIFGVVMAFLASTAALGFAFGLRKRINALAGPDPDDGDDD